MFDDILLPAVAAHEGAAQAHAEAATRIRERAASIEQSLALRSEDLDARERQVAEREARSVDALSPATPAPPQSSRPDIIEAHRWNAADLPARDRDPEFIVLHTTGSSLTSKSWAKAGRDAGWAEVERYAVQWYDSARFRFYAQWWIGPTGATYELAPADRYCYHSATLNKGYLSEAWREHGHPLGTPGWVPHERDPAEVWDWWDARWPGRRSPVDLIGRQRSINARSLSVDLLPTKSGDGEPTEAQFKALVELLRYVGREHSIPLDRAHVFGHADLDPVRRGTVQRAVKQPDDTERKVIYGVPWDPGLSAPTWSRLLKELER